MPRTPLLLVPLALALGVALGGLGGAGAQERRRERDDEPPAWARELVAELQRSGQAKRYELVSHTGKRTIVFDAATGRVHELDEKQVREAAPLEAQVRVRPATVQDETLGGVIRPR